MSETILLSFVIPCYRSEKTLEGVVDELRETVKTRSGFDYEIILVDDSSPDGVFEVIERLSAADPKIIGLSFAKNFGQHSALMAGLKVSRGDVVVCLDDDGQTPANELFELVDSLGADVDVAYASYIWPGSGKKHNGFRRFGSRVNDLMFRLLLKKPKELEVTSYFAAKRYLVDEACRYGNPFPYAVGLILRSTNRIVNVPVKHRAREIGNSGYTLKKLFALWFNGFTTFSVVPLRAATFVGAMSAVVGFIYALYLIIRKLVVPTVVLGYASTMAAILFIGGVQMLLIGILGEYVGRTYVSINNNPQYVIRRTTANYSSQSEVSL
ncbi:MAG: glycosyltransferase [Oscillospiraceae bacterium]